MWNFIKLFIIFIFLYHVLNTFVIFWIFSWQYQIIFSLSKDLLWIFFVVLIAIFNINYIKEFVLKYYKFLLLIVVYIIFGLLVSLINDKSFFDILIWIKYNAQFLIIFFSASFIWFVIKKKNLTKKLYEFTDFIFYSLFIIIFVWIIWQLSKFGFKDQFILYFWYGNVWDWVFAENPPIYYRTWPDWFPRLSWLFAWPNNYGFLLVAFFSFFIYKSLEFINTQKFVIKNYIKSAIFVFFYLISWIFTLSRWFFVGILPQVWYFLPDFVKKQRKYIFSILTGLAVFVVSLSIYKWDSTIEHMQNTLNAWHFAIENSTWLWFGSSWPGVHHGWEVLPENVYLQVFIDSGSVWFILWVAILWLIIFEIQHIMKKKSFNDSKQQKLQLYLVLLSLGFIWLLLEWLFLHVFEDSMVNYVFFITFGLLFGFFKD